MSQSIKKLCKLPDTFLPPAQTSDGVTLEAKRTPEMIRKLMLQTRMLRKMRAEESSHPEQCPPSQGAAPVSCPTDNLTLAGDLRRD